MFSYKPMILHYGVFLAPFDLEPTLSPNSVKFSTDNSLLDVSSRNDKELLSPSISENGPQYVSNEDHILQ